MKDITFFKYINDTSTYRINIIIGCAWNKHISFSYKVMKLYQSVIYCINQTYSLMIKASYVYIGDLWLPIYSKNFKYDSIQGFIWMHQLRRCIDKDKYDAIIMHSPEYFGSISSSLKNFLEHLHALDRRWFCKLVLASVSTYGSRNDHVINTINIILNWLYMWHTYYYIIFKKIDLIDDKFTPFIRWYTKKVILNLCLDSRWFKD